MKFRLVEENALKDPEVQEVVDELPPKEESVTKAILSRVDMRPEAIRNPNDVTRALDKSLNIVMQVMKHNRKKGSSEQLKWDKTSGASANVLLVGGAGTGKSSVVRKWAEARNINLVQKTAGAMDKSDMGGAVARAVDNKGVSTNTMTRLTNSEFESLQVPGSVLFLDELNRADPEVVGSLLTLILDHKVPDNESDGGMQFLSGFLFTVAAINPADDEAYEGTNEFDNALLDRFRQIPVFVDIPQYRRHLLEELQHDIDIDKEDYEDDPTEFNKSALLASQGRYALADKILTSPMFEFDTIEDEKDVRNSTRDGKYSILQGKILSPRGFSAVIRACDGTKEDLLNLWDDYCNFKKKDMIEDILADYVDVEDKANDALKYKDGMSPSTFDSNAWDKYDLDAALMQFNTK